MLVYVGINDVYVHMKDTSDQLIAGDAILLVPAAMRPLSAVALMSAMHPKADIALNSNLCTLRQRHLHRTASRPTSRTPQPPLPDSWHRMIGAEGADQSVEIKFDGVGAFVANCQEGVSSLDVGEVVAEELALALDPYPRKPGVNVDSGPYLAENNEFSDGPDQSSEAGRKPFEGLAILKGKK